MIETPLVDRFERAVPPPVPEPAEGAAPGPIPLQFTGSAREYFRIWIVNFFLSVLTLGIYSAWAKVRRRRYFDGHTWLAGANFEYHGDPKVILRGRLIAVLMFLTYTLIGEFSRRAAAAAALVALPLIPWLLMRSFRFNAVNTSYRNVRFGFDGRYRPILMAILPAVVFPLATVIFGAYDPNGRRQPTAGELTAIFAPSVVFLLAYPWMIGRLHLLRINGSRFGTTAFACGTTIGRFYGIYALAFLLAMVTGMVTFTPIVLLAMFGKAPMLIALVPLGYLALFALTYAFTQSRVANALYNATRLGEAVSFRSDLKARRLAGLYATNLLAIVATVGLAIPWAAIRVARARIEALHVEAPDGLEAFMAGVVPAVGAAGDEVGEVFAFDVSL